MIKPSQTSERASPAPESSHTILCKQKTAGVSLRRRSFYGRGWTTQAAHLKKPRRGFFPRRTVRRVDAVRIHPHENPNLLQTENRQRISTLTVFLWARVDSNHHGFVPPKPFDSKKLGIMRIFGHPKWNTKPFRPGRNVKSGLQSGLFLGVRGVLGQHYGDGLRSGNITARDIMCVPAEGIHTAAVADHAAQLSG